MKSQRLRRVVPFVLLTLAGCVLACGPAGRDDSVADDLVDAVDRAGDKGIVDMAPIFPDDAEVMYAFAGYTTNDDVRAIVGPDWPAGEEEMVPYDGRLLLVWLAEGSVRGWAVLNGGFGNVAVRFDTLQTPIMPDARFQVHHRDRTVGGDWIAYLARPPE